MNVAYLGPILDYSGYGEANRHAIAALHAAGVNVCAKKVSYAVEKSDFGAIGLLMEKLIDNRADYKIKILHTTPDEYRHFIEPGKYHIGHFFWETDRVPEDFAKGLQTMDEIWTGSEANKAAMVKAGVDRPIYIYPQAIEVEREDFAPYEIIDFDGYLFYSIFEWIDRKNPRELIKAYYEAFPAGENVGLMLKTYFRNFTLQNKRMIQNQINEIRIELGHTEYPPLFMYFELMDRYQIMRLHATGDCFVSAHRGEGWGIPQVEAALAGKPVVSTNYGGAHEYFKDGETAKLLPFKMKPLRGMEHSSRWYSSEQNWADVDHEALVKAFRWAYENPKKAKAMGKKGQSYVKENFNFEHVGELMSNRLTEIEKGLE